MFLRLGNVLPLPSPLGISPYTTQENSIFCLWVAGWEELGKVLGEVMTAWTRGTAAETEVSNLTDIQMIKISRT